MSNPLTTVDPAAEPFLSGRFAPVHDEIVAEQLPVIGTIPSDLTGMYLRNGPNPKFTPLGSYSYPLEGDGMIHGLWLEGGQARYANRYVETEGLRAEERAGKALFGGLMSPAFVDQSLLGDHPDPGWPFKLDAFVNIVGHGGHLLALEEGTPPYEITAGLDTVGLYDFGGGLPAGMCAHPKIDPVSGEMVIFRYDLAAPFLSWATVGADGTVIQPPVAVDGVDEGYMIHDFAITERYVVLVIGPTLFDFANMATSGSPLAWKPELGTRIALIPRDRQSSTRWVHTDAFWAWHYANAFDDGELVQLDFTRTSAPAMLLPEAQRSTLEGGFTRATLDPARGTVDLHQIDSGITEFPRIDDRVTGRPHRYVTIAGRSDNPGLRAGEHDVLHRYDMVAGTSVQRRTNACIGEAVLAPRAGATGELDGYYLAFGTDVDTDVSAMYIWDAAEFPSDPVAVIPVPQRIPNGLHGNWFPTLA